MIDRAPIAIIGAGPAGLIAADVLSAGGARVVIYERMPSVGRKLLMAGRGGLNLTHSEPFERFIARYGASSERLRPILEALTPRDLTEWAEGLGQATFVGSSGRVFPKAMKASPLLRALLVRLRERGVDIRANTQWLGWDDAGVLCFGAPAPRQSDDDAGWKPAVRHGATLFALGGASWPRLGSDGGWANAFARAGVALAPFKPANVGFDVAWSEHFRSRFVGEPLKTIALRFGALEARGDVIVTAYGLEGGAIYALSAPLRDAIARGEPAVLYIDLRPTLSEAEVTAKLMRAKAGDSVASTLRKALGLAPVAANLLREAGPLPSDAGALAARIKALPLTLTAPRGLDRAISSAGGVTWDAVDENLQLRAVPGAYAAGEMLDWEAPTGGYLLQACFASGVHAARAVLRQT
jgi:hypothetical protein